MFDLRQACNSALFLTHAHTHLIVTLSNKGIALYCSLVLRLNCYASFRVYLLPGKVHVVSNCVPSIIFKHIKIHTEDAPLQRREKVQRRRVISESPAGILLFPNDHLQVEMRSLS